ncbi:MAG: amidohydrolase [Proteobacteria bacterium]|nr:amidohydrolase [Pseudomonadota bacterium]
MKIALLQLVAALALGPVALAHPASPADLILANANIRTLDAAQPRADWIAIEGGRIAALGSGAPPRSLTGPATRVVDVHRKLILPAFLDAHTHPVWGGLSYGHCALYDGNSIADYQALIAKCAKEDPDAKWLYGTGWRDGLFAPNGIPDKHLIDAVVADRPAAFSNVGGHGLWLNSKALEAAGITRDTPDPPHGRIDRDANGEPIGGLQEAAVQLVTSKLPPPSEAAREQALLYAIHYFNSVGIVGFHDALVPVRNEGAAQVIPPFVPETYLTLEASGRLKAYVTLALGWDRGAGLEQVKDIEAVQRRLAAGGIAAHTVKFLLDGVPVQRTAALIDPYADKPDERGALEIDPPVLDQAVAALSRDGFQVHFHAIGDRAVQASLDALAYAKSKLGRPLDRPLISHVNLVAPADRERFHALGAIPIFQPLWASMDDYMKLVAVRVGPQRMTHMYPVATLMHHGVMIAYGSDWPVASANPFEGIEVALTRRAPGEKSGEQLSPSECIGLDDALLDYTLHAAYTMHLEDRTGSLVAGKDADLIAVDQDVYAVPTDRIGKTHVLLTLYKGEAVYGEFGKL